MPYRKKEAVEALLRGIEEQQRYVEEKLPYPLRTAAGKKTHYSWRIAIALTCFFAYLIARAGFHEYLFLSLIPTAVVFLKWLRSLRNPLLLRRTYHYWRQQKYDKALECNLQLIRELPDYLPGRIFIIELLMCGNNFTNAAAILDELHDYLDPDFVQNIQSELILRKRIAERKGLPLSGPNPAA